MPFSTIIRVANMGSRASVDFSPCRMIAAISETSIVITEMVSTSVPYGSPSWRAMASACRTTLKTHASITSKIQKNTNERQFAANKSARQTGTVNTAPAPPHSNYGGVRRFHVKALHMGSDDQRWQRPRSYHHGNLKEVLLEAARKLIEQYGPAGFSLTEAARLAGVSPAAPYRHFRDREALLAEVARNGFERFAARFHMAWTTASRRRSPRSRISAAPTSPSLARSRPATR